MSFMKQKTQSESPVCEADETENYEPKMKEKVTKLFRTIGCLAKKLQPSDMTNTILKLQCLNGLDLECRYYYSHPELHK